MIRRPARLKSIDARTYSTPRRVASQSEKINDAPRADPREETEDSS
jgi:hypothetical protein